MSRIITISREFGSGGRELGKRLAETMGIAYYDYEIIKAISEKSGLAVEYVNSIVERHVTNSYPIKIGRSFAVVNKPLPETAVFKAQSEVIRELAEKGDAIFIGRCADYILRDKKPLRIMVYADMEARLQRCREKAAPEEHLSDAEMKRDILAVDKRRAKYYGQFTGQEWGNKENFDLCINTTGTNIKGIIPGLAELIQSF